ncbi:MAG: DUF2281 domain-containing protein [Anaerolineales bacterium]|nr:DUF2281 domain-containing protein [Anaerolineales bacterium]
MNQKTVWQHFSKLPPEAQQQVIDFIAFLQTRYVPLRPRKKAKPTKLAQETFIGMWRDRKDLRDSTAWVRNLRASEWGRL